MNALQNAIANGVQAAINNAMRAQQQQPQPVPPAVNTRKSTLSKPEEFEGDYEGYERFKRQFTLYILANPASFPDDQSKILFVTSYMTKRLANRWAQNFIDQKTQQAIHAGHPDQVDFGSWIDFMTLLDGTFIDPNKERNAQEALLNWTQGTQTAESFFNQFDILRRKAGYDTGFDAFLIGLLERNCNPDLVVAVYSGTPPITYDTWKDAAILKDGLRRRLQNITRQRGSNTSGQSQPRQNHPTNRGNNNQPRYGDARPQTYPRPPSTYQRPAANSPQGQQQRDPTGTIHPGQGQPMEIDRQRRRGGNCNRCGRMGHWARDCKSRNHRDGHRLAERQQVRQQGPGYEEENRERPQEAREPPVAETPRRDIRAMIEELNEDEQDVAIEELLNRLGA